MNKLTCYYAHTMLSYDSKIEKSDIKLLESLGFQVVNPSNPGIKEKLEEYTDLWGEDQVMNFFEELVREVNIFAFRGFPDGSIPSGIAKELNIARNLTIPIIELPCNLDKRMLTHSSTRTMLNELGFYK